jgi:uncharacterized caspase-like protein
MPADSQPSTASRATLVNAPGRYRPDIDRWAVIVGISEYQHRSLNLRWAHRDAEELYELLLTPAGGSFAADHVQLLVDQAATTQAVSRALRSFLKKPAREDVVLIYFACHGGPDPDRPNNLYLLTHDTDPDDIAGTALPMREIDLSLRENLLAERVVVLADTCHSAGIGGGIGRRSVSAEAGVVNAYLDAMSAARGGLALLTSAEASETSQEDARWGDGHGVFTYYLLEGLRGADDGFSQPRDGKVAVGELFDYVRQQVQQATANSQHPAIGSNPFDRELPLAITGGIGAQEHLDLGRCLHELARIAGEPDRYRAATRQFEEALRLSSLAGAPLPEAGWRLAQAWLAAGEATLALDVLARLAERSGDALPPPARFTLALCQAVQGDSAAAATGLERYLERYPGDAHASWGRYCQSVLKQPIVPRALLIGISQHVPDSKMKIPNLRGPANDVPLFKDMLTSHYGFPEEEILVLMDEGATWAGITNALEKLAEVAQPLDPVVFYLSGIGFPGDSNTLITHGGSQTPVRELHERLLAIPSAAKFVVVDGEPSQQAIELAEQAGDYALLIAAQPGQHAIERFLQDAALGTQAPHGAFTHSLVQAARTLASEPASLAQVMDLATKRMKSTTLDRQSPVLAGRRDQPVFRSSAASRSQGRYAQLSAPERWAYHAETLGDLAQAYERFQALDAVPYAQGHLSFGRAFLAHSAPDRAIAALTTAVGQAAGDPQAVLALGQAQVAAGRYGAARDTFRQSEVELASPLARFVHDLHRQAEELASPQRHALVVGIDRYAAITALEGAANDARAVRDALVQRLGFQPENIVLLLDAEATRERVLAEFRSLAGKAPTDPALFYFAGYGAVETQEGAPLGFHTLVCADSRSGQTLDLRLSALGEAAAGAQHLVTVADCGEEGRSRQRPTVQVTAMPAARDIGPEPPPSGPSTVEDWILVGRISLYGTGTGELPASTALAGEPEAQTHGALTYALLRALEAGDPAALTYRGWLDAAARYVPDQARLEPVVRGAADEPLFDPRARREALLATVARLEFDAVYQAIELLRRQIGERSQRGAIHPDGWVSLGVAYGVLGDYSRALEALEAAAAATTPAKAEMAQSVAHDVSPEEIAPQISYHLGRLLLASQQDYSRAVSELRSATRKDPDNGRAFYYLGRAIREMVQRETLAEVEDAFSAYLNFGAPVGHRSEVVEFLRQRAASQTKTPVR